MRFPIFLICAASLVMIVSCNEESGESYVPGQPLQNTTTSNTPTAPVVSPDTVNQSPSMMTSTNGTAGDVQMPSVSPTAQFSYKISETTDSTGKRLGWGYTLLMNNTPWINQKFIPAISGNIACSSEADARKLAEFVVQRANKYKTLPTVSVHEIDSLKIKH